MFWVVALLVATEPGGRVGWELTTTTCAGTDGISTALKQVRYTVAKRFTPKDLPAGTVVKGVWQMLTFTFDTGTGRFYKNGALIATKAGMPAPIRWRGFHMTHWFNGGLDDVRLYDRALGDAEVATLYKSAGGKTPTKRVRVLPK